MITKIDIAKFGLFKNYEWKFKVGNNQTDIFKKVNIIYGRNYSGKTTLARIFRCVEKKEIHENYVDSNFTLTLLNSNTIKSSDLNVAENYLEIRVYNSDFVREHLSWLHNDDGTIQPFTILGSVNIELDKEIRKIDEKLGSEESQKGLIYELSELNVQYISRKREFEKRRDDLNSRLRSKAQSIKNNASIYNVPTYQINSIKADISSASEAAILSAEIVDEKNKLLKEESLPNIPKLIESKPNFKIFLA